MNEKTFEQKGADQSAMIPEKGEDAIGEYERYKALGGIINEKDYKDAQLRAHGGPDLDEARVLQAENIARHAGISLDDSKEHLDPRVILYAVLRGDRSTETPYHHGAMSDQRLFAEVLRMTQDEESLKKLIEAYPNISFQ